MKQNTEVRSEKSVAERPILFSTDMVKGIMGGRKTMTRRVVSPQPISPDDSFGTINGFSNGKSAVQCNHLQKVITCPYGQPGDLLWVRETFFDCNPFHSFPAFEDSERYLFKADDDFIFDHKWKPSIHMPKDAARIWLEVTNIRVERLQDISHEDAKNEGVKPIGENCEGATIFRNYADPADYVGTGELSTRMSFRSLWDSINSKITWNDNPWVWVISFKVLSTTGKPKTERGAGDDYPVVEAYHKAKKACQ